MKKQVWSSLLALSMTASMLSPAALAAQITVPDDNQNAIAVVSDTDGSSGNSTETNSTNSEKAAVNTDDQSTDSGEESPTPNAETDFETQIVTDGVEITGYTGTATEVVIPETIDGGSVVSIGISAFKNCTSLEKITLPDTVTSICAEAFENSGLKQINIPGGVTEIKNRAFYQCDSLKTVYYGSTLNDWSDLKRNIGENNGPLLNVSNMYYTSGDYTYQVNGENEVTITKYNGTGTEAIIPPAISGAPVVSIGEEAFKDCTTLKDVTIPTCVTSIGKNAFAGCTGLEKASYDTYKEFLTIADGNEPLTKVLSCKSKIICKGSKEVKISTGTHELRIHGQSYGEYTFTWVEDQAGWTVQNSEGQYLSFADGELVLLDEPFIWHYDAKLYTTTEEKVQHKFWWRSYTTTETVYWYLTGDGENLTLSKSDKEADLALYDAVAATEHSFGEWTSDGNGTGTHSRTCAICGKQETEKCTYGENGYCTVCGAIDPEQASVSVTAKVTKHTTRAGWWWGCTTTTWTADITATGTGVDVDKVEYSTDGETYKTGTSFTSKKAITTFYIRVTDSNDNVTNWIYADGEVTQVTDQDSGSDSGGGE